MTAHGLSLDRGTKGGKTFALRMIEWADPDSLESDGSKPRRERLEATLIAAMRALAGDGDLAVTFGGRNATLQDDACTLPRLRPKPSLADWTIARGQADSLALHLRYRDRTAERRHRLADRAAADAFDLMQRCRSDALGARRFLGVAANLDAALAAELARHGADRHTQANLLPIRAVVTGTLREALGVKVGALASEQIDPWKRWLNDQAPSALERLVLTLQVADAYAEAAAALAPILAGLLREGLAARPGPRASSRPARDPRHQTQADRGVEADGTDRKPADEARPSAKPAAAEERKAPYRIYTNRYDRVVDAGALAPMAELERSYAQLQADMAVQRGTIARLANRLQRTILAQQRRSWDFDQEEGMLDTAKLDRVVVNPGTALSFKVERAGRFRDTAVTLLIDNSGSMRGLSIQMAATATDIVAQALERCGVAVEILGFTTTDWRGGRPAAEWARTGKPNQPGRLNALCHIIYKRADKPGRQQRHHLGAMLRPAVLKENIDGEALLWASGRLAERPEARKILMVISDGAPNDAATMAANGPAYLDHHLRSVIARLERQPGLELRAIGIGHPVDHYYSRAITLKDASGLGPAMISQLAELFEDQEGSLMG